MRKKTMFCLNRSLIILILSQIFVIELNGISHKIDAIPSLVDFMNEESQNTKQIPNRTIESREKRNSSVSSLTKLLSSDPINSVYILSGEEEKDKPFTFCSSPTDDDSIYRYSIPLLNSSMGLLDFSSHKGVPILIVNVATFCESTIEYPQYNELAKKYKDKLFIVGFPSNNFANQEPSGDAEEIYNSIKYIRPGKGFVPAFPLTKRIDVNGENSHQIYSFLKRSCPSTRNRFTKNEQFLLYKPRNVRDIRWNFEKFLIHPLTGHSWKRYDQKTLPEKIIPDIEEMIAIADKNSQK